MPQAVALLRSGVSDGSVVHPPLGKWLIATGILVFGENPVGWRAASAVAGVLTVLGVYLAGRRLFRHAGAAVLAAGLVAVDGLAFTMSRIAMLDVFLGLFVVAGFLFLVRARGSPQRRWVYLAGVALGCALATKWSAAPALAAALVAATVWAARSGWRSLLSRVAAPLIVLPLLVYVASYAPWFATHASPAGASDRCGATSCAGDPFSAWAADQLRMADGLRGLPATHPSRSSAAAWPVLRPPMPMYLVSSPVAEQHVLALGNPVLWWLAIPAAAALAWRAVRWREGTAGLLVLFPLALWLPWLLATRPVFFYYMLPAVPFLALAVGAVADSALDRPALRWLPPVIGAAAVGAFAWLYPLLTAATISPAEVGARLWLFE